MVTSRHGQQGRGVADHAVLSLGVLPERGGGGGRGAPGPPVRPRRPVPRAVPPRHARQRGAARVLAVAGAGGPRARAARALPLLFLHVLAGRAAAARLTAPAPCARQ